MIISIKWGIKTIIPQFQEHRGPLWAASSTNHCPKIVSLKFWSSLQIYPLLRSLRKTNLMTKMLILTLNFRKMMRSRPVHQVRRRRISLHPRKNPRKQVFTQWVRLVKSRVGQWLHLEIAIVQYQDVILKMMMKLPGYGGKKICLSS